VLPDGIVQAFTYDDADRITQVQYLKPNGTVMETITYTYDASGRRLSKSLGSGSIQETGFTATYNEANRLMAITFTATGETYTLGYDDNGNLSTKTGPSSVTTYSWDSRNRLVAISGPGLNASFQYDALGRRVAKT